jgi:hypothetical protein
MVRTLSAVKKGWWASGPGGQPWTEEERAQLGTVPDSELAARIGRTATAVRVMRTRQGIPSAEDRRHREHRGKGRTRNP